MMRLLQKMGEVVLSDPDIAGFASNTGSGGGAQTANTGRGFIVLKPRDQRELDASQIIDRLRPKLAKIQGATLFLQPSQDHHRRRPRLARRSSNTRCKIPTWTS